MKDDFDFDFDDVETHKNGRPRHVEDDQIGISTAADKKTGVIVTSVILGKNKVADLGLKRGAKARLKNVYRNGILGITFPKKGLKHDHMVTGGKKSHQLHITSTGVVLNKVETQSCEHTIEVNPVTGEAELRVRLPTGARW